MTIPGGHRRVVKYNRNTKWASWVGYFQDDVVITFVGRVVETNGEMHFVPDEQGDYRFIIDNYRPRKISQLRPHNEKEYDKNQGVLHNIKQERQLRARQMFGEKAKYNGNEYTVTYTRLVDPEPVGYIHSGGKYIGGKVEQGKFIPH